MTKRNSALMVMALVPFLFLNADEQARATYRISAAGGSSLGEALTNQKYWLDADGNACEESDTLDSNADYLIGLSDGEDKVHAKMIRTSKTADVVFSGRSLTIGDDSWGKGDGVLYVSKRNYITTFLNDGLFLRFGRIELLNDSNADFKIDGKVTIVADGTSKRSFNIGANSTHVGQTINFYGPLMGGESSVFGLSGTAPATARFFDAAGYSGTVICRKNCGLAMAGDSGAKVVVETNGTIFAASATVDWSLADLSLETNTTIRVATSKSTDADGVEHTVSSTIHVKNELHVKGIVSVSLSMSDISFDGLTNRFVVLTAPKSASLDIKDFVLDFDMGTYPEDMRRLAKLQVEQGDGIDSLVFTFEPVVKLDVSDKNKQTNCLDADTSFANAKERNWSDRRLPHEGAHYVVLKSDGGTSKYLNTMGAGRSAATVEYETRHFPGESLTIGEGCALTVYQSPVFKVKELRLLDGSSVRLGQFAGRLTDGNSVNVEISGDRVVAPSGTVTLLSYTGYVMVFSGSLSGGALVSIPGLGATSSPAATTKFTGENGSFTGKFLVSQCNYNKGAPKNDYQTLEISATNQFGGVIPDMAWDGIWLKRMCRITIADNAALASGSNRGLYIDSTSDEEGVSFIGQTKINYEKEFAIETQLTMNGVFKKEGPGTLTLAAPVKFGEGAVSDMPLANSNVVQVAEGILKVRSADGIDGLEIHFGGGTRFVVDVSAPDADFLRYGAKNVKTDTPFVLPDGATKLPLEVLYPEEIPEKGVTVGILTVKSGIASAIKAILPELPRRVSGKIVRYVEIADKKNGWTTFAAEIGVSHGTRIILK